MNNISGPQSDYEQLGLITTAERDILASVLHVADKFCLHAVGSPSAPADSIDAGDHPTASLANSLTSVISLTKGIRTLTGLNAMVARSVTAANADDRRPDSAADGTVVADRVVAHASQAICRDLVHDILVGILTQYRDEEHADAGEPPANQISDSSLASDVEADPDSSSTGRSVSEIIDELFVTRIVNDASQSIVSIPRCVGVHDLHLGSSKALLDGGFAGGSAARMEQRQESVLVDDIDDIRTVDRAAVEAKSSMICPAGEHEQDQPAKLPNFGRLIKGTTKTVESITDIIDYDSSLAEPKMLTMPQSSRTESVCPALSVTDAELAARKATRGGARGTWSRIKRVFSSMSGRSVSTINMPN